MAHDSLERFSVQACPKCYVYYLPSWIETGLRSACIWNGSSGIVSTGISKIYVHPVIDSHRAVRVDGSLEVRIFLRIGSVSRLKRESILLCFCQCRLDFVTVFLTLCRVTCVFALRVRQNYWIISGVNVKIPALRVTGMLVVTLIRN